MMKPDAGGMLNTKFDPLTLPTRLRVPVNPGVLSVIVPATTVVNAGVAVRFSVMVPDWVTSGLLWLKGPDQMPVVFGVGFGVGLGVVPPLGPLTSFLIGLLSNAVSPSWSWTPGMNWDEPATAGMPRK